MEKKESKSKSKSISKLSTNQRVLIFFMLLWFILLFLLLLFHLHLDLLNILLLFLVLYNYSLYFYKNLKDFWDNNFFWISIMHLDNLGYFNQRWLNTNPIDWSMFFLKFLMFRSCQKNIIGTIENSYKSIIYA